MSRVKYQNQKYLQRQAESITNAQVLSDKEMSIKMGVSRRMWARYKTGMSPIPQDLIFNRSLEDFDITVFCQEYQKKVWGL
jgi:hypothetical protein